MLGRFLRAMLRKFADLEQQMLDSWNKIRQNRRITQQAKLLWPNRSSEDPMKKTNILILAAVSMLATIAFNSFAADDKKEDSTISKAMKAHFKGDTSDIKKAAKGELSKDEVAKLVTAVKALSAEKPPEGDAADYKKKNDALVAALEKLAGGAEGAGAAVKEAANCKACHDAHKPK